MALYTVPSEHLFIEQLHYNLLYRWFLDMDLSEPVFDNSSFSKNQERFLFNMARSIRSSRRWWSSRASAAG